MMQLRDSGSRRRPRRYDEDDDFEGDGGQQVSTTANTSRRSAGRPQRAARSNARQLGANDFDDPYGYSGFSTGPTPMVHSHRFNPELTRNCAFPSLPIDHDGPGPSEIWKAQNMNPVQNSTEPAAADRSPQDNNHGSPNPDDVMEEDENYPDHLLSENQLDIDLDEDASNSHEQVSGGDNLQPVEAAAAAPPHLENPEDDQVDRPFATTGPFWNQPAAASSSSMNPNNVGPHSPFDVLRQAYWTSQQRAHDNNHTNANLNATVPQASSSSHNVLMGGYAKLKWVNWSELSANVRYLIVWIMTSSGDKSFTRAAADLCLNSHEMGDIIDLVAVENANWAAYKQAVDNADAEPLVVLRPASLLDRFSKAEIQAGKDYLQFIGLYDLVETLDGYEGVQVGPVDDPTIPLTHSESDGYRGLLPQFNVACQDELRAMRKEEQNSRLPVEPLARADFLVRMDPPPGTINPRRVEHHHHHHHQGGVGASSPRWPLASPPVVVDALIDPALLMEAVAAEAEAGEEGQGTILVRDGDYRLQADGCWSPRPGGSSSGGSGPVVVDRNDDMPATADNFWGLNLGDDGDAFTGYPEEEGEDVEMGGLTNNTEEVAPLSSSRKGKEVARDNSLSPFRPNNHNVVGSAFGAGSSATSSSSSSYPRRRLGYSPAPPPPLPVLPPILPALPLHLQPGRRSSSSSQPAGAGAGPSRAHASPSMSPDIYSVSSPSRSPSSSSNVGDDRDDDAAKEGNKEKKKYKYQKLPEHNPDGTPRKKRTYIKSGRYSKVAKAERAAQRTNLTPIPKSRAPRMSQAGQAASGQKKKSRQSQQQAVQKKKKSGSRSTTAKTSGTRRRGTSTAASSAAAVASSSQPPILEQEENGNENGDEDEEMQDTIVVATRYRQGAPGPSSGDNIANSSGGNIAGSSGTGIANVFSMDIDDQPLFDIRDDDMTMHDANPMLSDADNEYNNSSAEDKSSAPPSKVDKGKGKAIDKGKGKAIDLAADSDHDHDHVMNDDAPIDFTMASDTDDAAGRGGNSTNGRRSATEETPAPADTDEEGGYVSAQSHLSKGDADEEDESTIVVRVGPRRDTGPSSATAPGSSNTNNSTAAISSPGGKGKSVTAYAGPAGRTRSSATTASTTLPRIYTGTRVTLKLILTQGTLSRSPSTQSTLTQGTSTQGTSSIGASSQATSTQGTSTQAPSTQASQVSSKKRGKSLSAPTRSAPARNTRASVRAQSLSANTVALTEGDDEDDDDGETAPRPSKRARQTSYGGVVISRSGGRRSTPVVVNPDGPSRNTRSGKKARAVQKSGPSANTRSGAGLNRISASAPGSGFLNDDEDGPVPSPRPGFVTRGGKTWKAKE